MARKGRTFGPDFKAKVTLATAMGDRTTAHRPLHRYGVRDGMRVIDRLHTFACERGKQLIVVLSYPVQGRFSICRA